MTTSAMNEDLISRHSEPERVEAHHRFQLAAFFRLLAMFGMTDHIYTHVSAAVPGAGGQRHFLINPYGLRFEEVTASNLVKIDMDGNPVEATEYPVNPAGFTIHSAIHAVRHDAICVAHTHTRAGMAVAALKDGLLPISQISLQFHDRLAYHDYEGIALDLSERERLQRDLGDRDAMVLANHGLLTAGRSIPHAFSLMYYLNKACEIQISALSMARDLVLPPADVCEHTARQYETGLGTPVDAFIESDGLEMEWQAFVRLLDRQDSSYRN